MSTGCERTDSPLFGDFKTQSRCFPNNPESSDSQQQVTSCTVGWVWEQVRAKLGQSAPHSGSLAADLADARSKAGVPHSSGSQTNASSMVSTFAGWL
jgi:hypothetical protein